MSHLTFPPRKILFSRSDKVVAERRKLLEVLVNFVHVYSTLMLLFALHNLSVNLRERGERAQREILFNTFSIFSILQVYLRGLLSIFLQASSCDLHPSKCKHLTKQDLCDYEPFFKRGLFETGKHSTT